MITTPKGCTPPASARCASPPCTRPTHRCPQPSAATESTADGNQRPRSHPRWQSADQAPLQRVRGTHRLRPGGADLGARTGEGPANKRHGWLSEPMTGWRRLITATVRLAHRDGTRLRRRPADGRLLFEPVGETTSRSAERVRGIVTGAWALSAEICQACGGPGDPVTLGRGGRGTRCADCREAGTGSGSQTAHCAHQGRGAAGAGRLQRSTAYPARSPRSEIQAPAPRAAPSAPRPANREPAAPETRGD